jgi:pimeloyl-ACP methyl ester carboxylesterase
VRISRRETADPAEDAVSALGAATARHRPLRQVLVLLIAIIMVVIGAELLVEGAVSGARSLGVSDAVIGLTIVAIGTTAPEFVTTVTSTLLAADLGLLVVATAAAVPVFLTGKTDLTYRGWAVRRELRRLPGVAPAHTPDTLPPHLDGKSQWMHVDTLARVSIGGADQWLRERSDDRTNPIVLYLHGGPGTSQMTLNRRNTRDLERCFTVVNWDQRGAGKSYAAIRDAAAMNIDQFVSDTREVTRYLLHKFRQDRLVLVGHSWGSAIGALTVARSPELYSCYVGIGQIADMAEGEARSYQWVLEEARRRGNRRALRSLERIGPPPYTGDWRKKTLVERAQVARFGGEVRGRRFGAVGMVLRSVLVSSEYTLRDRVNFVRGVLGSMRLLWPQLLAVDLFDQARELQVPVFLMEGRYDWEVPSVVAARYFEVLRAPSKRLIWFEHSAHLPNVEERERFNQIMRDDVRQVALA